MSRLDAYKRAYIRFGIDAVVGHGRPYSDWGCPVCYYVGSRHQGFWAMLGMGKTWDEAFSNIREVVKSRRDSVTFAETKTINQGEGK
jgi:hypothetical protein